MLAAAAAPQLRYIMVARRPVIRSNGESPATKTPVEREIARGLHWRIWRNREGQVTLERLEDREIADVELFNKRIWAPLSIYNEHYCFGF